MFAGERSGQLLEHFGVSGHKLEVAALGRERLCDAPADPPARAGDKRRASRQSQVHIVSPKVSIVFPADTVTREARSWGRDGAGRIDGMGWSVPLPVDDRRMSMKH